MDMFYAGIGSRKTPDHILVGMTEAASELSNKSWCLRSGGAKGADSAFQLGVTNECMEIYRPSPEQKYDGALWNQALMIAADSHPAWRACSDYAKALHARNVFQVLGADLNTPSRFVMCWTPDGAELWKDTTRATGGTGTAIRIADMYGVPVFNLANESAVNRINHWLF